MAKLHIDTALKLDKNNPEAWMLYGLYELIKGHGESAKEKLR